MPKKEQRPFNPITRHTEDHSLVSTCTFVTKHNDKDRLPLPVNETGINVEHIVSIGLCMKR